MNKPIVLVGMMGSGKSSIGCRLAALHQRPFFDADAEIEKAAGKSIPQIFADDGEAAFRALETKILAELLQTNAVIATGGGAILNPATRTALQDKAIAIWLQADINTLYARVRHDKNRPLLQKPDPKAELEKILAARQAYYAQSPIHIQTDGKNPDKILEEITQKLGS